MRGCKWDKIFHKSRKGYLGNNSTRRYNRAVIYASRSNQGNSESLKKTSNKRTIGKIMWSFLTKLRKN